MSETEKYKKVFDDIYAPETTKTEVYKMISENKQNYKPLAIRRIVVLVAAAVLVTGLGMIAYAAIEWSGFALTGDMNQSSLEQLLKEASTGEIGEMIEADGTVHFFDKQGDEVRVLSAEEAKQYEQELEVLHEETIRNSTSLVNIDTLPLIPAGVTELEIGDGGIISDFALGNGYMVIICDNENKGFSLESGNQITISLTSNDECRIEYYLLCDGVMLENKIDDKLTFNHSCSFEVTDSGSYCLAVMYTSSAASNFTNGNIVVH